MEAVAIEGMGVGAGIISATGLMGLFVTIWKYLPAKQVQKAETPKNEFLEKILQGFIDISEKQTKSMTVMQAKTESIHHRVNNINMVVQVTDSKLVTYRNEANKTLERMETIVSKIWDNKK